MYIETDINHEAINGMMKIIKSYASGRLESCYKALDQIEKGSSSNILNLIPEFSYFLKDKWDSRFKRWYDAREKLDEVSALLNDPDITLTGGKK